MEAAQEALEAVVRVGKKQKTCAANASQALSEAIAAINQAAQRLEAEDAGPQAVLAELTAALKGLGTAERLAADTKELHGAVSKLSKVIDRSFSLDVCKTGREPDFDADTLDGVIAEHLYHEGLFEVADAFAEEAGVQDVAALKAPYLAMHQVLHQIQHRNLGPVLEWVAQHDAALRGPGGTPSAFEFGVHRLAFLQLLQEQGQAAALKYARAHFGRFQSSQLPAIQRLMGQLAFAKRSAAGLPTPYAGKAAASADEWAALARDFMRQSCALMGQAQDSPLLVAAAAGAAALPTLLKLASLVALQPGAAADLAGGTEGEQLPIEVPLANEFVFHSIFACPVSRDQSSPDNPPMVLPCGHCICKQSILKIAKAVNRSFKCPYCPAEASLFQCRELTFPDAE